MIRKLILAATAGSILAFGASAAALAQSAPAPEAQANSHPADQFSPIRVQGTIVDVAVGDPAFSTLVSALTAADLVTTLQGPGPFTVFAPTNDAFAKVPAPILNLLLSDVEALRNVLLYHVAPRRLDLRFQFNPRDIKTVQGQEVYAERERNVLRINNSEVVLRPIVASNGVIYVIDSVLLPQYR
jgi:uncharacterized surface protein with fasciclin (FAS1) repeats